MPTWTTAAKWRVPRSAYLLVFRIRLLPQRKITRVVFRVLVTHHAGTHLISRVSSRDRRPYVGNFAIAKYTDPSSPLYATPRSSSRDTSAIICGMYCVAGVYTCAGLMRR